MRAHATLALLALAPLALAAPNPDPTGHAAGVLQGFSVSWEARPHRLHSLGFGVVLTTDAHGQATGSLSAHVRGGSWASGEKAKDTPNVELDYAGLAALERSMVTGSVDLVVSGRMAHAPEKRQPAAGVAHVQAQLPDGAVGAAVYLSGFRVDTDPAHPDGFTLHELAFRLLPATVSHGQVQFDAVATLVAAAVPDRAQDLESYGATIHLDYVIVSATAEDLSRVPVVGHLSHGISSAADRYEERPQRVAFHAQIPDGARDAFVGLSGLRVAVDSSGYESGRYLRDLEMRLIDVRVDPFRRDVSGTMSMLFSNVGEITRPVQATVEADVTVLALHDGERAWSGRWGTELEVPDLAVRYPADLGH